MTGENGGLQFLYKCLVRGVLLGTSAACLLTAAQPRQRISGGIDDGGRFELPGNVRPAVARAEAQGEVSGALRLPQLSIHFTMTPSQQADLLQLLRQQQTRHSSQFHHWLTPEQFGERFGLNQKDLQKVTAWLESMGFTNVASARSRNFVTFNGTAAQAEAAFHTRIQRFNLHGQTHFANSTAPQLPGALNGMVSGVRGLHDFRPKPRARVRPHFTSNISGNHFLAPYDFATIYNLQPLYGSGIDGSGRTIAIPGQTDLDLTDIHAFQNAAGLPVKDPQVILSGTDPGVSSDDVSEADLDVEWAGGIAKGATVVYVNSSDVFTSMQYAISNNVADVMAVSYGECEASAGSASITSLNSMFQQANAQGMTIVSASGDDGAADCDTGTDTKPPTTATHGLAVDFPSASPYVTGVGGTTFSEGSGTYWNTGNNSYGGSATSYIPEVVWNDSSATDGFSATGGGASIYASKPSWQTGTGVPADNARDVPDVALAASPSHDGFLVCTGGSCVNGFRASDTSLTVYGGTSTGSPGFGAIVTLLVQQTGQRQGNINPNLYTLASVSTDAFHDITSGNNKVTCTAGTTNCGAAGTLGFTAGTGYDQTTGLGSVDAEHLFSEWGADITSSISPTTLSVARGSSGSANITVNETNFNNSVSFTCSVAAALTNTTCSVSGGLSGSGTATLTVTAGSSAEVSWWRQVPNIQIGLLLALGLAGCACLLAVPRSRALASLATTAILMLTSSACGGGSSSSSSGSGGSMTVGPVSETGLVTVVATSGALTSSATISVTVQ